MEVNKLRKKINDFEDKQSDFRKHFRKMRFFVFQCRLPYEYLEQANGLINEHERKMKQLQDSSQLFEVQIPEFKMLQLCRYFIVYIVILLHLLFTFDFYFRKEIRMLKQLWDYIFLVKTSVDEWKTTPWVIIALLLQFYCNYSVIIAILLQMLQFYCIAIAERH